LQNYFETSKNGGYLMCITLQQEVLVR